MDLTGDRMNPRHMEFYRDGYSLWRRNATKKKLVPLKRKKRLRKLQKQARRLSRKTG